MRLTFDVVWALQWSFIAIFFYCWGNRYFLKFLAVEWPSAVLNLSFGAVLFHTRSGISWPSARFRFRCPSRMNIIPRGKKRKHLAEISTRRMFRGRGYLYNRVTSEKEWETALMVLPAKYRNVHLCVFFCRWMILLVSVSVCLSVKQRAVMETWGYIKDICPLEGPCSE